MNTPFEQVIASYHRARETGQLFDTFYRIFLGKSPEIPSMFARTDFPHQKLMLRESILEMLVFAQTGSGRREIERLGERHRQLNVTASHYELWLDALCEALGQHDPQFTSEPGAGVARYNAQRDGCYDNFAAARNIIAIR